MVTQDDTVAVLHALRELAEGQSYFREHLSHAHARIAELERRVEEADLQAQVRDEWLRQRGSEITTLTQKLRRIERDLGWSRRYAELERAGLNPWSMEEEGVHEADKRLEALADIGAARMREEHVRPTIECSDKPVVPDPEAKL